MPIGSSLGITLPTVGASTNTWGSDLNTELNKVITAVEAQVPASAIDFSADFDLNGYAVTSAKYSSYTQQTSVSALNAFYVKTDGNFYGRDGGNNEIQFTASGALNNASAGGLGDSGGTYGTSGITFDWDGTEYNAKDGSGADDYANVVMNDLLLNDGSGNELTIGVPSMGSNYTVALPSAVAGGATTILQSDASGNCSWSNTFSTDITLTGSATLNHGTRTIDIHASAGTGNSSGTDPNLNVTNHYINMNSVGAEWDIPVVLPAGVRITQVEVFIDGGDGSTKTAYLDYKTTTSLAAPSNIASGTSTASIDATITMSSVNHTVAAGEMIFVRFVCVHILDELIGCRITYDQQ
jgi:hypothetical protein